MPIIRKFKKLDEDQQKRILTNAIGCAILEDQNTELRIRWRTDIIGIAMQYYGRLRLRRSDFRMIFTDEQIKQYNV